MKKLYFKHQLLKKEKNNNNLFNTNVFSLYLFIYFFPSSLFSGHKRNIKGVN